MLIPPDQYASQTVYDLLTAAGLGRVGIDQRLIHAIADRGDEAMDDLLTFADEDHSEDPVNLEEDLIALFHHLGDPRAVPYLVNLVAADPYDIPDDLMEALVFFRQASLEPLLQLHGELAEEAEAQDQIAFLLAGVGVHDDRVRSILQEQLSRVPVEGAMNLALYVDPSTRPMIEQALEQVDASEPDADQIRANLANALSELDGAERGDRQQDTHAIDLWSLYPEEAAPAMELLEEEDRLQLLGDASAEVRQQAATSFFDQELSEEATAQILRAAQTDTEADVRALCWEALAAVADRPEVQAALTKAASDSKATPRERAGALVGLFDHLGDVGVRAALDELYAHPETRAKALEAMWRSLNPDYADLFILHIEDEDPDVRRQALRGVAYSRASSQVGRLERMFTDLEFRPDALFAYALASPTELSPSRAKGFLRRMEELAKGFSEEEEMLVQTAIDQRLLLQGMEPVFFPAEEGEES